MEFDSQQGARLAASAIGDEKVMSGGPPHIGEASHRLLEILPGFLDHLRVEESRKAVTLVRYQSYIERLVREIGDCPVEAINAELVNIYKRRLLDAGLSAATISGMISCLRTLLRYLRDIRQLQVYDPEKVRRPRIPKREVQYLTSEEVQRFLIAIPTKTVSGLRDRALVEVLCSSGMRISEALSLNRDSIDWEAREATVVGKGNKQRKIYFGEEAAEWMARYLERRWDDQSALFVTNGYEPRRLGAQGTWRRLRRYGRLAGLGKDVYPHMLRHTMATTLLMNGCPIGHIRTLLGHASLATTCRYYLGRMSDAEAKAAHAKYLSYDSGRGNAMGDVSPGRENVQSDTLTDRAT